MLIEKIYDLKKRRIKQWPQHTNRASNLGHECLRYLVFERTRWQEKTLHDLNLQLIFDEGNTHERALVADLNEAGVIILEQQRPFVWEKYQITGTIDGKALVDYPSGNPEIPVVVKALPIEIKSCSQFVFPSLNKAEDLYHHKYHHVRMYPSQMTLYLLMDNKPEGVFIFKNKQNGQLKEIPMLLDYELGEKLIQKAEAINTHVSEKTTPECMKYDEMICGGCGYLHICLPEVKRTALEITDDPDIELKLNRREELKPLKSEYEKLDEELKKKFKDKEKIVVANFLITGKSVNKKAFSVNASTYWQTKIQTLKQGGEIDE